ncbi:MAG: FKBP-type peptidyl-prolyl cis-trans isomerase [Bacteroidetes bacterium]|jgi:FKBP-type peptidyl-prolyl cis-trans isomerase FklB|nr:FKBP-type peptidyl-prolyl cis-trans isomerase [Bacteroidota bacterium]
MKTTITLFLLAIVPLTFFGQTENIEELSTSLGLLMGNNMKSQGFENLDPELFAQAMKDAMEREVSDEELSAANKTVNAFMQSQQESKHADNKKAGEEFLAKNKLRPEVKVTESGLQYEILETGEGPIPTADDKVKVHYHGTLINGEVFDSSVDRGEPISFPVTGVIQGWQEALQMMPVGSKWKLYIPYDIAYGERGAGSSIKPYSTLIFEISLLEIE